MDMIGHAFYSQWNLATFLNDAINLSTYLVGFSL
jgi:hypothetical protein